jgi:type II secretory pathway component PulJ
MFWSHREQLKDELRVRLRVAADLATLGAYEMSERDDLPSEHTIREEPQQRVFLFAKVAPVCPHSAPAERGCSDRLSTKAQKRNRSALRQRGGAVQAPAQPCVCPVERVPAA